MATSGSPASHGSPLARSPEPDDETCAKAKLGWARKLLDKEPKRAKTTLEDLVRVFPRTKAAGEGKELLKLTDWQAEARRVVAEEAEAKRNEPRPEQPIIPFRIRIRIR